MISKTVLDHLSSAGINIDNISENTLDGYFSAIKDREYAYLPDASLSSLDRAVDALNRVAADFPDLPVAFTSLEQEHGTFTVVSFVWEESVRFDILFPFALSLEGTAWGTASSAANAINGFYRGEQLQGAINVAASEQPEWAKHGFVLLFALPPEGYSINDIGTIANFDDFQIEVEGGEVQKAASSLHGHHVLSSLEVNEDEKRALFKALGATFDNKVVSVATLLAIGALNPFASNENLILRETVAGTIVMGSSVVACPAFSVAPSQ